MTVSTTPPLASNHQLGLTIGADLWAKFEALKDGAKLDVGAQAKIEAGPASLAGLVNGIAKVDSTGASLTGHAAAGAKLGPASVNANLQGVASLDRTTGATLRGTATADTDLILVQAHTELTGLAQVGRHSSVFEGVAKAGVAAGSITAAAGLTGSAKSDRHSAELRGSANANAHFGSLIGADAALTGVATLNGDGALVGGTATLDANIGGLTASASAKGEIRIDPDFPFLRVDASVSLRIGL